MVGFDESSDKPAEPEERLMKLTSRALFQGLLLPFRMYFQPLTILSAAAAPSSPDHPVPPMWQVYLFSLLWIPIGIVVGLIIFGPPRENALVMLVVIPGLLILLGALLGRSPLEFRREGQLVKRIFNYPLPVAFGVVFGLTALFNGFVLEMLSRRYGIGIAEVVDSRTLDAPAAVILGVGLALSLNLGLGSMLGPRKIALYGSLLALALLIVTYAGGNLRADNLAASLPAFLLIGHLGLQPLYFLIGLAGLLLSAANSDLSPVLWRLSPACWCEYSYVPLPGLGWLLRTIHRANAPAGARAVSRVMFHPFYHQTAERIARELGMMEINPPNPT